ncbi:MAG: hypothetical protein ACLU93_03810 [Streptococcus sp.]
MKDSILRAGDISIVQINSRFFVMKVGQNRENGDILLNPLNSDKPPITCQKRMISSSLARLCLCKV